MKEAQRRRQNVRKKYCSAVGGPILSCKGGREKFLLSTIAKIEWRQEIDNVIFEPMALVLRIISLRAYYNIFFEGTIKKQV